MPFKTLDYFLDSCVKDKKIPGCVCWVGNKNDTLFFEAYGHAQIAPRTKEMAKYTVFDVASITKPMVTAFSTMLLHERGLLQLDSRVGDALPLLKKSASADKTIRQLLAHTSGLASWYPTYLFPKQERILHIANLNTGEEKVVYSCLGYILLGKIIEQITNMSLAKFFSENIARKFDLETVRFGPLRQKDKVAATEQGNNHEQNMASQHGDVSHIEWRKDLIHGEVHDGNAFYGFGNVAGNAGLFSNAADLAKLIQAYLATEIVSKRTLNIMTKDHTGGVEKRGLG
jgi:CubicO group peptidase (beta-lactamase class C family)